MAWQDLAFVSSCSSRESQASICAPGSGLCQGRVCQLSLRLEVPASEGPEAARPPSTLFLLREAFLLSAEVNSAGSSPGEHWVILFSLACLSHGDTSSVFEQIFWDSYCIWMRLLPWLSSLAFSARMPGKGVCVLHQQHFLQDRPSSVDREVGSKHLPETHPGVIECRWYSRNLLWSSFYVSDLFNDEKTDGSNSFPPWCIIMFYS